jgi:hypothetical protein
MRLSKVFIMVLSIFISAIGVAEDQWYCRDDQAFKNGNLMGVCGVGTASTEGEARRLAFVQSVNEFKAICQLSADCGSRKFTVEPKRSTCIENAGRNLTSFEKFTCHRLLVFTIQQ